MKSISQITTWLNTPGSIKCILADITGVGGSPPSSNFYLSSLAYYDSVAGAMYNACINGNLSFSESLSADGSPSISSGSIEITNTGGVHDAYLLYIWRKRSIKIYFGDPSWPKDDFVLIFDGLVQDLTAPSENALSFTLFDKLQRLNDPITETNLTSTSYSQNTLNTILPLTFGECFNVQPLLVDNGSLVLVAVKYICIITVQQKV